MCCEGVYEYRKLCKDCKVKWVKNKSPQERLDMLINLRDEAMASTWYQRVLKSLNNKLRLVK